MGNVRRASVAWNQPKFLFEKNLSTLFFLDLSSSVRHLLKISMEFQAYLVRWLGREL